ncbi:MAG: serine/threonine protein kinase [Myxococcota bacterium]
MSEEQATIPLDEDVQGSSPIDGEHEVRGKLISERYRLEECLGQGAMGSVYLAEHVLMKKKVAVKLLRPEVVGHGEIVERFRREAQAAAHIDHPNICTATDFGEMDEGFFLVMEYLEGETLDVSLVEDQRFDVDRALHIVALMCDALEVAHEAGIVHRDLKPENVMLIEREGDSNFPKIMDFGVARVRIGEDEDQESARLTRAGMVYGTPHYMSPEQAAGAEIDRRADIYSLGVMLFEMLTGSLPFFDTNPAKIMAMHMTEEPPSMRRKCPEAKIPRSLDRLVQRLLAKEPEDRPSTAGEVRQRLNDIAEASDALTLGGLTREAAETGTEAIRNLGREVRPGARRFVRFMDTIAQNTGPRVSAGIEWALRHRKHLAIGAIMAFLAVAVALPVVILINSNAELSPQERLEEARDLADDRSAFLRSNGAGKVMDALATGSIEDAVGQLESLRARTGPNPHLAFLLGRAYAQTGQWDQALEQYEYALAEESRYASEERLIADLKTRLASGEEASREAAKKIVLSELPAELANDVLGDLAWSAKSRSTREDIQATLESTGRMESLDPWHTYAMELRAAKGCKEHAKWIEKLANSGDPDALAPLRFYAAKPTRGCGTFNSKDCYGCIRDDLDEAIQKLEPLEESNSPDDGSEKEADEPVEG